MERWKPVVGYEGLYVVSDEGRIKTVKSARFKQPSKNKKDGRKIVMLWRGNKGKIMRVSRLVLFAFAGAPEPGQECCHNDGVSDNDHISNLRWDTAANNQKDRVKHGTSNRGERCAAHKLTEKQVLAIRLDARLQRIIAADYGIRESAVSRIKTRKRWAHI